MNNYFVILGAGKSKRFHKKIDKQFYKYKSKEIIEHSIEKSLEFKAFQKNIGRNEQSETFKKKRIS